MAERKQIAVLVVQRCSTSTDGEGEFLVGKRTGSQALAGFDEFPGGHVRPGELPLDAAVRECAEESGLDLGANAGDIRSTGAIEPLVTVKHDYDFGQLELHFFRAVLGSDSQARASEPRPPFRWLSRSQLAECRFPPANAEVLQRLLAD